MKFAKEVCQKCMNQNMNFDYNEAKEITNGYFENDWVNGELYCWVFKAWYLVNSEVPKRCKFQLEHIVMQDVE